MSNFKVGDRVFWRSDFDYNTTDVGILVKERVHDGSSWWVKWESNGRTQWVYTENVTLLEVTSNKKDFDEFILENSQEILKFNKADRPAILELCKKAFDASK